MAAIFACYLSGCHRPTEPQMVSPTATDLSQARSSVTLRVGIENAPGDEGKLAAALGRLRGEWAEANGGQLEVVSLPSIDIDLLSGIDLLIFPSKTIGPLCEEGLLRPVRKGVLEGDDFDASDIFPVVRNRLVNYGQQPMALPLSVQIPALSASPHGAMLLIVRAAPLAWDPRREGFLFDPESMQPRIGEPPFVQALEEIVAARKKEDASPLPFVDSQVTVLGSEGRMVGVTSSSRNAAGAFRLLAWIASAEIGGQLLAETGKIPVRLSHFAKPARFFGKPSREIARDAKEALSRSDCLVIPRIPGIDDYLKALQQAVDDAVSGSATPQEALATAAESWEDVTDQLGREKQMQAYLRHLNLE